MSRPFVVPRAALPPAARRGDAVSVATDVPESLTRGDPSVGHEGESTHAPEVLAEAVETLSRIQRRPIR